MIRENVIAKVYLNNRRIIGMNIVFPPDPGDESLLTFVFDKPNMEYIIDLIVLLVGTLGFLLNSFDFTRRGDFNSYRYIFFFK